MSRAVMSRLFWQRWAFIKPPPMVLTLPFSSAEAHIFKRGMSVYLLPVNYNVRNKYLPAIGCRCKNTVATNSRMKKAKPTIQRPTEVVLDGEITVDELAKKIVRPTRGLLKIMRDAGVHIDKGPKTVLDLETAEFILSEFDVTPIFPESDKSIEELIARLRSKNQNPLVPRPPVVTIMGHVDHGKTTLLDNLRKTSVAEHEAGGITQHIGAFSVNLPSGKQITFIDTPGHAAFNDMRSRGARMTDVVILVVAANDGVQQQTLECISHIKAAQVPVVVAINKIDKPNSNVSAVKTELFRHGLHLEEFGGDIAAVEISALKGLHLDKLEETIILQADLLDLKAEKAGYAQGVILEARTDKQRGLTSTVLVQKGELKKGSSIIAGTAFAKIRQLFDDKGKPVNEAIPSQPIQVLGWRDLPNLGDTMYEVENEEMAKELIQMRLLQLRKERLRGQLKSETGVSDRKESHSGEQRLTGRKGRLIPYRVALRQMAADRKQLPKSEDKKKLEIIVKADVSGSLEAVLGILNSFKSDHLELSVASSGVGSIVETDIQMAEAIDGKVYGFNIRPSKEIDTLSKQKNIPIKFHKVIYSLLDDIKDDLASLLPPMYAEDYTGEAQVLQIFRLTGKRKGVVAGCRVKQGLVAGGKDSKYKVLRNGEIKHEGSIKALKHGLEDIAAARIDMECGISLDNFKDFQEGDILQCFKIVQKKIPIDWGS